MPRLSSVGRGWLITAAILAVAGSLAFTSRVTSNADSGRVSAVTTPTSDAAEVALALSAAPASLTVGAEVYVWHDGHFVKDRTGSTGVACMVSRDPRVGGVFPMCFDPEAARTQMPEEMMRTELKTRGLADTAIKRQVDAAFANGMLHYPTTAGDHLHDVVPSALTVSDAKGTHLTGAWRPHVMIYLPHTSAGQFALGAENDTGPVSAPFVDAGGGVQLGSGGPALGGQPGVAGQFQDVMAIVGPNAGPACATPGVRPRRAPRTGPSLCRV